MANQSPDYKQLYFDLKRRLEEEKEEHKRKEEEHKRKQEEHKRRLEEEKEEHKRREEEHKRKQEEHKRMEEEHKHKEEEHKRKEEEREFEDTEQAIEKLKEISRRTTLPEFLDACHNHLPSEPAIRKNTLLWTQGDPMNARNKLRPEKLAFWNDFPAQQEAIWNDIMESEFPLGRCLTSIHTLREFGENIQRQTISSEFDLFMFRLWTVEEPLSRIVENMYNNRALRRKFDLRGSLSFENHANTLSPGEEVEQSEPPATARDSTSRSSRPRADQFCVYNKDEESRIPAFVVEYKMPHKIPLGYIYEGLVDMELDDVVECCESESSVDCLRRLVAAIVTQAFSYMIQVGLEYGCVCTGEANIFLRVPEDPKIVYYFLSVPKGDVGDTTGWVPDGKGANRLHLTAVGQMLAFTLQALKSPPRSQKWREVASAKLKSWEVSYSELLEDITPRETPSSAYRLPQDMSFFRASPVQFRQRQTRTIQPGRSLPQDQRNTSNEKSDPNTPSRQLLSLRRPSWTQPADSGSSPSYKSCESEQGKQYCTQNCLLGLANGGRLDLSCPNVRYHGTRRHQISLTAFLERIRQQLSKDLDDNCEPIGKHGACGVPFRIRLGSHGYTVVAKACPVDFVHRLRWEATVYNLLLPIQGTYVPVYLGNVDLEIPYYYEGIAQLVHMMFLSYGGKRMDKQLAPVDKPFALQQADKSVQAIRTFGILHRDLALRNMLWDGETRRVMVIDFERAKMGKTGVALRGTPGNT